MNPIVFRPAWEKGHEIIFDRQYNVDYEGGTSKKLKYENDDMTPGGWREFVEHFCRVIFERTADAIYICMGSVSLPVVQRVFIESGGHWSSNIIWAKDCFTLGRCNYKWQYENILYGWPEGAKHTWRGGNNQGNVWEFRKPKANRLHPTMKPVALISKALRNSSRVADTVADFLGGSGSTLIASEKLKRRARVVELDPRYCDVIVKRWERFTGRKAVREDL